jgi:transposase
MLDGWLEGASKSELPELGSFAISLRRDEAAVRAALSHPWSGGQVEGQIHRLKLIKRQGYGRAGFELLKRRVLGAA